jgi:hypothetical protein
MGLKWPRRNPFADQRGGLVHEPIVDRRDALADVLVADRHLAHQEEEARRRLEPGEVVEVAPSELDQLDVRGAADPRARPRDS